MTYVGLHCRRVPENFAAVNGIQRFDDWVGRQCDHEPRRDRSIATDKLNRKLGVHEAYEIGAGIAEKDFALGVVP